MGLAPPLTLEMLQDPTDLLMLLVLGVGFEDFGVGIRILPKIEDRRSIILVNNPISRSIIRVLGFDLGSSLVHALAGMCLCTHADTWVHVGVHVLAHVHLHVRMCPHVGTCTCR